MSTEKINELKVKLIGTVNIPKELQTNTTIDLKINKADCLDYRLVNNQDGTYNRIYNVKISELSEVEFLIVNEKIEGTKKRSAAQRLRARTYVWCSENDMTDPEMFYQTFMQKIINSFDEVWELVKNK